MFRLYWKKIIFLCFLLLAGTGTPVYSQGKRMLQPSYDAKRMRFGYLVGMTSSYYTIRHNRSYLQQNDYYSIGSPSTYHVRMGGLVNFVLNDHFDFRVLPTVSIYSRALKADTVTMKQNDKAWFEIPAVIKYKSLRRGNTRMYMFSGLRFGVETNVISFGAKRRQPSILSTKTTNFSVEYGMGLEFFREYFKFAPELTFSHGLNNMIDPIINSSTPLGRVEKLKINTVSLVFTFE